ncbi:hypothetical protein PORUE0001_0861 [Porphyromonas uenonis 60-3]|uniref:Uncharacterized protein n=1 Tax=Porphyromonas uenonis 60-3 TaxID=596327 RepID=C2MC83_9PORP|nr:autotransporter domain-containing protein [Porphyromonas uenonis]EEK16707.1 hypothetical protein PORUE0001_0861 [Porphyromonas uenonis 60-3]
MNNLLKKAFALCALVLATGYCLSAQVVVVQGEPEAPLPQTLNEVRLNLLAPVAFKAVSLEYERATTKVKDLGFGATISASFAQGEDYEASLFPAFGVMPYARWYFGGKKLSMTRLNSGFFIEANTAINYNRYTIRHYNPTNEQTTSENKRSTSWGIGLGGGWKFVSRSNWSGEISIRVGRNLVKGEDFDDVYVHPAISVGYRF